jgi:hypothetical protein
MRYDRCFASFLLALSSTAATAQMSTVAGTAFGGYNGDNISAVTAWLNLPSGVAVDNFGNVYIADMSNDRIRKVDVSTGMITTVAGNGFRGYSDAPNCHGDGGMATETCLFSPRSVAFDRANNLYIADSNNARVRKVSATGLITTIAGNGHGGYSGPPWCPTPGDGGPATKACVTPQAITFDKAGNLYIAEGANERVRRVDGKTAIVSTVAGNGIQGYLGGSCRGDGVLATQACLDDASGVAVDGTGGVLIADEQNNRIRRVDPVSQIISTVAGIGVRGYDHTSNPNCPVNPENTDATLSCLNSPWGVTAVGPGKDFLIVDKFNSRIRLVLGGIIFTVVGDGVNGFCIDGANPLGHCLGDPRDVAVAGFTSTSSPKPPDGQLVTNDYGTAGTNAGARHIEKLNLVIANTGINRVQRAKFTLQCCGGAGTLGALVTDATKRLFILSNDHVFGLPLSASMNGATTTDAIVQPTSCKPSRKVATFTRATTLGSGLDAAIAELTPGTMNVNGILAIIGIPPASDPILPTVGMSVVKIGAVTGLTCGTVQGVNITPGLADFDPGCSSGAPFLVSTGSNKVVISPFTFSEPGDSGSLIMQASTARPVALLQGAYKKLVFADSLLDPQLGHAGVLSALNIQMLPTNPHHRITACPAKPEDEVLLPDLEAERARIVKESYAPTLLKFPGVVAVGVGAEEDNPLQGAILIFVQKGTVTSFPTELDGVSTRVIELPAPESTNKPCKEPLQ